jgi:hypothetical protein
MGWSGDASVDVSVVNWVKGTKDGKKRLFTQKGNDPTKGWSYEDVGEINSSLSFGTDVSSAKIIKANAVSATCFQGQTHGHEGFLLTPDEAAAILASEPKSRSVIHPFLIGNELTGQKDSLPNRYVIDFHPVDLFAAQKHKQLIDRIRATVLPDREAAAKDEEERNKEALADDPKAHVNHHHANFLNKWWHLSWSRGDMKAAIAGLSRYIVCSRVTLRPIFEFVEPTIHPNDALNVFAFEDDYSFGILQSDIHWQWFVGRCSTIPYFNGGLFATIEPIDLTGDELRLIGEPKEGAAWRNWSKINPSIFGTIFQQSMDQGERHAFGAHFTHEVDIQRIIGPTITQPWRERIDAVKTMKDRRRSRIR